MTDLGGTEMDKLLTVTGEAPGCLVHGGEEWRSTVGVSLSGR
jgi:hypothetical protein